MRLFGRHETRSWEAASKDIAIACPDLRNEFYQRCVESLDWNIARGIIRALQSRRTLSGYAELSIIAFQFFTAGAVSIEHGYIDVKNEEMFLVDLGPRLCGGDNEMAPDVVIREVVRFRELQTDPELLSIRVATKIASHLYREDNTEADRRLAAMLFTKLVPSFYLRLHVTVARAFGDVKTARRIEASIGEIRAVGAGY
jgi:hypothetical protein